MCRGEGGACSHGLGLGPVALAAASLAHCSGLGSPSFALPQHSVELGGRLCDACIRQAKAGCRALTNRGCLLIHQIYR